MRDTFVVGDQRRMSCILQNVKEIKRERERVREGEREGEGGRECGGCKNMDIHINTL